MQMKTILCYGDSNTWGYTPSTGVRYAPDVRWTGVLQRLLGGSYRVLEAGLTGRTTIWDDPLDPNLNGSKTLIPVMRMGAPLDLMILMLGTNDLKWHSAWEAAAGCSMLLRMAHENAALFSGGAANVLLVSPAAVCGPVPACIADPDGPFREEESRRFGAYYQQFAAAWGTGFFDAASAAAPARSGELSDGVVGDGVHLTPGGHLALGRALADAVRSLLP